MALEKCKECAKELSTKAKSCPHCGVKIDRTRPVFKIIGVILLALFAASMFASKEHGADAIADRAPPMFSTTAREISSAYHENTVSADNKFKNKRFEVSGTLSDINTDLTDRAVLVLKGGINEFMEPQAELADGEKPFAANLKKGAEVVLVCTGNGDIAKSPLMNNCILK